MNPSDPAAYQSFIEQLLTYNTVEQIASHFQHDDDLLTPDLLQALFLQQKDTVDADEQRKLTGLFDVINYMYSQKCFKTFLNLPYEEALEYAKLHVIRIATQANYSELESIITRYADQPDMKQFLKIRQSLFVEVLAIELLIADDWLKRRQLLLSGLVWLAHPAANRKLAGIAESNSMDKPLVESIRSLISRCQMEGVDSVVNEIDIDWLVIKAQESQNEEKIHYLKLAIILLSDHPDQRWASLLVNLGDTYQELLTGNQADNLDAAIQAYKHTLQVYTRDNQPYSWAMTQARLNEAYSSRIQGDRADNLENVIRACEQALLVFTQKDTPQEWAEIHKDLSTAYLKRIQGDRVDNLENAIRVCEQALLVFTQKDTPQEWAGIYNNLSIAYQERIQGDRADNLENAIKACNQALLVFTQQDTSQEWAGTQTNLGNAYQERIRGDRADNLENAIKACNQALLVFTQQDTPQKWASTQNNLGNSFGNRVRGERADNLENAIKAFERALMVWTQQDIPYDWATAQNNLGNFYRERIRGERVKNLEAAIHAYEQTLLVYSQEKFPYQWARTQANLGTAYYDRIQGERAANLEVSIHACEQALLVYTQLSVPYYWASTQSNLGNAYYSRIQGERDENLEAAIHAYEQALLVYSQEKFPYQWASTKNNLGKAYKSRKQGERAENLEAAIQAYQQALLVRTKESIPLDCHITSLNLADLLYTEQRWTAARQAYEQAHQALELLRGETLKEESRRRLAQENATLDARLIHCCLLLDDLGAAANYALAGKSRTLTEQLAGERQTLTELLAQEPSLLLEYVPIKQRRKELDELVALMMLPPAEGDTRSDEEVDQEKSNQYSKIVALRWELNTLTDNLVFAHPSLSAIQPLPPIKPSDAQALAAALGHVSLVEYIKHAGGWGAFVITAQEVNYIPLAGDLMDQIGKSLDLFLDHSDEGHTLFWTVPGWEKRLDQLYQGVFKPLLPYLPLSGEVVLAPTRSLHLVPFQALRTERGNYISETYAFSFVPSLATLRVLYEQSKRTSQTEPVPNRLLNVSHSGSQHNYLVNVSLEAKEVGRQFADPIFLSEEEATLNRVIEEANKRAYQVVHFNCHGNFLPDNPAHSGLLLAQQHMLTVNDIRIRIRLQGGPLVTLSACQTGQTLPEQADETTGISWSFLAAGASSVLSSQWSVPDASTRELFKHFYQLRRQSGVSDAEALRQAMLEVRKLYAYRRPVFWAGFQVMGLPISSL